MIRDDWEEAARVRRAAVRRRRARLVLRMAGRLIGGVLLSLVALAFVGWTVGLAFGAG